MVDVRSVIISWFIKLKQDTYVLIRIESLVALVTVMFLVLFILDIFRCRSGNSIITMIMKTVDGVSDQIVVYLIGAMQSADFKNDLFPVWAIVLVSLRASLGYLSGYSITDRERRITELGNVIKFIGAGVLNGTRTLEFTKPLWSLWAILTLRSVYKFVAHGLAIKSLWHGQSSEFLPEFLHLESSKREQCDDKVYQKMRYLVYGEANQEVKIKKPSYVLDPEVTNPDSLVTLGKIHECFEPLLKPTNSFNPGGSPSFGCCKTLKKKPTNRCRFKDMSLAFALSRLLRCRLEDVPLYQESINMTRELIISEIIDGKQENSTEAFRILEWELAFIRDYFYTLYPVVFWRGLLSLSFSLLQSVATIAVTFWLAVDIRKVYKPRNGNLIIWVNGWNVDVIITWVFMFFIIFKEVWEMVTYLLSNWTRLLLVCKYVQKKLQCNKKTGLTEGVISSFFKSKITDPWHGNIGQYEFLHSCTYKATFWQLAHTVSLGKIQEKFDGRKAGNSIKVPKPVKEIILNKLRERLQENIPSLKESSNRIRKYERASLKLHTCSQEILVWHIATSLCEIKLAQEKKIDFSKPGFLNSVWSYLKHPACCSSQQFLLDGKIDLKDPDYPKKKDNYQIAISLSRYCAYLLVFQSELLPDSFTVPHVVFEKTLEDARNKRLKACGLALCRYNMLMALTQGDWQDREAGKLGIVDQGVKVFKDLTGSGEDYWETLADVWADLLVDIAPSWNAEAHKHNLESGGEFITLIWALLWHCGIEKSSQPQEDIVASGSNSGSANENITETRSSENTGLN